VFWELNRACPDAVPPEALSSLEECFRRNLKRNVILASELLHLLDLLHQAGIQVIPFKGPTLAWLAYETPGLRRVTDLDLLLPERDAGRAIELLLASGYRRWLQSGDLRFFATSGQVPLLRTDGLVAVDLHWLLGFRRLNFSYFHDRLRPVDIDGRQVATFCQEDLLTYLCVHGGRHGWSSLTWICDVARLIDGFSLDWDALLSRAEEGRMSRALLLGIRLARELLGASVPHEVWKRVETDAFAGDLANLVHANLPGDRSMTTMQGARFQYDLLENMADKLSYLWDRLQPSPSDWEALRIPVSMFPVYYIARPIRLAWNCCVNPVRGDSE